MKVDWKARYDELAVYTLSLSGKLHELEVLRQRIQSHVSDSDRLSQRERNVARYCRLKEDMTLVVEYHESRNYEDSREFKAGTLIDAEIRGRTASVYLDDDGDGFLHFPADKLEVVEIPRDEVDWKMVVSQG